MHSVANKRVFTLHSSYFLKSLRATVRNKELSKLNMHWSLIFLIFAFLGDLQITKINCKPQSNNKKEKFKLEIDNVKQQLQDLRSQLNELTSSNNVAEDRSKNVQYCLTKECIAASNNLFEWMNLEANPCDDFNEFACGNFIKNERIPEDKKRWSASDPLEDLGKFYTF